jgi:hypothetical protein
MKGLSRTLVGLAAAQVAFAATFRGPRSEFWQRMTITGATLGSYALAMSPQSRRTRIGPKEVALGLGSAAVLYATFWVGDRVSRKIVPTADRDIEEIYALRELRPRDETALRLATIIGPAEELFWRGLIQQGFMRRYGRLQGTVLGVAAYGGVHVVTGNFTLFGAATVAGVWWCLLYALGMPLGALVVSHVAWDIWIFLLQPTNEVASAG